MKDLLDNIFWHALSGRQAKYSSGEQDARRYARGFSPILGFANVDNPNFPALVPHCGLDEHFYCDRWRGKPPEGWQVDLESTMFRMVWDAPMPDSDAAPDAVPLEPHHAEQALQLALLTNPGPFGPRTIELGDYFGFFEGDRLVAMAGERLHAGALREVSGVCTHPDFQGRGYARRLVAKLVRRQMQRGQTSFLHVMRANESAHGLYQRMGYVDYLEPVVRVVSRVPADGA